MPAWLQQDWCSSFVLTLGHFVWQGALIAVVLAIALRAIKSVSIRYWLSLAALLLMAASPVVTLGWLLRPMSSVAMLDAPAIAREEPAPSRPLMPAGTFQESSDVGHVSNVPPNLTLDASRSEESRAVDATGEQRHVENVPHVWWQRFAPQLTTAYLCGVGVMLLRLAIGLWGGRRLRRRTKPVTEDSLLNALQRQTDALGMKLLPVLAYCERVTVPTVVGILKPMILLPLSLTSGLSPEQIESVLAHELAHLRRCDHLVNLLQRVIESLLFFHPAMWWVSHRIREEREHCCDDLVVACGAMPLDYAKSLLRVAELSRASKLRRSVAAVSLLATGDQPSNLRQRIARLLGESATPSLRVSPRALLLAIGIPVVAAIATIQSGASHPIETPASDRDDVSQQTDEDVLKSDSDGDSNPVDEEAARLRTEGRRLFMQANYPAMAEAYAKLCDRRPVTVESVEDHLWHGHAHQLARNWPAAVRAYHGALNKLDERIVATEVEFKAFEEKAKLDESIKFRKGSKYLFLKRDREQLPKQWPDFVLLIGHLELIELKDPAAAAKTLSQGLRFTPELARPFAELLANAEAAAKTTPKTEDYFRGMQYIVPLETQRFLAMAQEQLNQPAAALDTWSRVRLSKLAYPSSYATTEPAHLKELANKLPQDSLQPHHHFVLKTPDREPLKQREAKDFLKTGPANPFQATPLPGLDFTKIGPAADSLIKLPDGRLLMAFASGDHHHIGIKLSSSKNGTEWEAPWEFAHNSVFDTRAPSLLVDDDGVIWMLCLSKRLTTERFASWPYEWWLTHSRDGHEWSPLRSLQMHSASEPPRVATSQSHEIAQFTRMPGGQYAIFIRRHLGAAATPSLITTLNPLPLPVDKQKTVNNTHATFDSDGRCHLVFDDFGRGLYYTRSDDLRDWSPLQLLGVAEKNSSISHPQLLLADGRVALIHERNSGTWLQRGTIAANGLQLGEATQVTDHLMPLNGSRLLRVADRVLIPAGTPPYVSNLLWAPVTELLAAKHSPAETSLPEGLEFLKPYPKLHGLSLDMTEPQFLEIVKQQELTTRKTVEAEKAAHHIALGDDHTMIVMFDKDAKCSGIQRVRGEQAESSETNQNADQKPVKYKCRVVTSGTKKPIAGATVVFKRTLNGDPRYPNDRNHLVEKTTHVTDAEGWYEVTIPPEQLAERYLYLKLDVSHSEHVSQIGHGYAMSMIQKNELAGDRPFFETTTLHPGKAATGTVVTPDARPAAGVKIVGFWYSPPRTRKHGSRIESRTDAEGKYRVVVPVSGGGVFWLVPEDACPVGVVVPNEGGDLGKLTLKPGLRPSGQVLDADGRAVAGMRVEFSRRDTESPDIDRFIDEGGASSCYSREAVTDSEGRFVMPPVEAGKYELEVSTNHRSTKPPPSFLGTFLLSSVSFDAESKPLEVRAVPSVEIRVRNLDSQGQPKRGFEFSVFGEIEGRFFIGESSRPADGRAVARVPRGLKDVELQFGDNEHGVVRVRRKPGAPLEPTERLKFPSIDENIEGIEVVRYKAPILLVKAVDAANQPIADFTPSITYTAVRDPRVEQREHIYFEHQSDGRWRTKGFLPDEDVTVSVAKQDWKAEPQTLRMTEGQERELVFVLKPQARAGRGALDPALDRTAGLPNSDEETKPLNKANGDLRSNPAAGSGDPRRAQDNSGGTPELRTLRKPTLLLPDHWIMQAVGFDNDGKELVTASNQSFLTIRRWDVVGMKLISEIKLQADKHGRAFREGTLMFSGDRRRVVAATDAYVGIWETATGKLLKQLPFKTKEGIYDCAIDMLDCTPDLSVIVGHRALPGRLTLSYDAHLIVWDGVSGNVLQTVIDKDATDLKALDLSTDGKRLVTTNGGGVKVWETSTGKLLRSIPNDNTGRSHVRQNVGDVAESPRSGERGYESHGWSVQFSPDGKQLAMGDILGVKLLDTTSGKLLQQLEGPYRYSSSGSPGLVFSKDGQWLARLGTQEKTEGDKHRYVVPIWSTRTGARLFELHTEANDAAFSDDGQRLAVVFSDMQQALSVWHLSEASSHARQSVGNPDQNAVPPPSGDGGYVRQNVAGPGPHSRQDRVEENGHYVGKTAAEFIDKFQPTWGDTQLGLQYGIALTKPQRQRQFRSGERVPLVVFFRNASDKPIKFDTAPDFFGNTPKVLNTKGEPIALENIPLLGHIPHYHEQLAPGEALGPFYLNFGLGENPRPGQQNWHPYLKTPVAGQYKLTHSASINVASPKDGEPLKRDDLTTGTIEFEITDASEAATAASVNEKAR